MELVTMWFFFILITPGEYVHGPLYSDTECAQHRQWAVQAVKLRGNISTEKAEAFVSPCTHFAVKP